MSEKENTIIWADFAMCKNIKIKKCEDGHTVEIKKVYDCHLQNDFLHLCTFKTPTFKYANYL